MISDDLVQLFQDELRELLDSLDRGLLDLRMNPEDAGLIDQVFRDLHTIKGNGAMFGFAELSAFVHKFETAFDDIRSGRARVTPEVIRLALAARDEIPGLVEGTPDETGRRSGILAALSAVLSTDIPATQPDAAPVDLPPPAEARTEAAQLAFRLTGPAFELGQRPDLLLAELAGLGATDFKADVTGLPCLEMLEPSRCDLAWTCTIPATVTDDDVAEVFMFVDAKWDIVRAPAAEAGSAPVVAAPASPEEVVPVAAAVAAPVVRAVPSRAAPEAEPPKAASSRGGSGATVRVPADRLDALMDAVGELVIVEARLTELARNSRDSALMATAEQITRLAAGLRDATMTMRMVPMRTLVGRFRRLVSEVADKLEKQVSFVVVGEETELDKTLIEKLADPLVHILRNSLDHGIETAAEREKSGKPVEAVVELTAQHAGTEVLVRIRDDGRGMDPEKLRAKAVSQGLIAPDAVLSEQQLFGLIFEPGFSTAATVTELSGRGVGMDVVRRTIEGLRGSIEIDSVFGVGTTVTLRMPLTLAIIEGLLVEVEGERYTLPMTSVQEIVALPADKFTSGRAGDFLDVRGHFVPFLRLRNAFDCGGNPPDAQNVVIVTSGDTRIGVVVDRIIGTNQVVIKQMSKLHVGLRTISGATILGDGSVALILDVPHLVALGRQKGNIPNRSLAA